MDYRIEQVLRTMDKLERFAKTHPIPKPDRRATQVGIKLSRQVCSQPEEVVATPLMKNLMVMLGDIELVRQADGTTKHTRMRVGADSKAVAWINKVVRAALLKFNGPEKHDYDESIPIDSVQLYNIDCWNGWKESVWDIQPGQAEQVVEGFKQFENPKTTMDTRQVRQLLRRDPAYQQSVLALLEELPVTRASREISQISDPFMSKGTGVSYPDYRNDRSIREGSQTYGQYEIELATQAAKGGIRSMQDFALKNNTLTGYARWQRGKGRPLIAASRRTNLIINCVNGPEMQQWKETASLRAAFVDEEQLLQHLSKIGEWVLAHPESDVANIDYTKYDQNMGAGWILLQDAVRYLKAADEYTRQLILVRYTCNREGWFVNGPAGTVRKIFGRQFSGELDTTLGNSTDNRLISRGALCTLNKRHIADYYIPLRGLDLTTVGDDLLAVGKKGFINYIAKVIKSKTGEDVHEDEKHARGIMFIQYRAFKLDGMWVMAYNWPRVLRSMLSKETKKQLGMGGWTLAWYQQLGKLIMYPEACSIALNITAALDPYHLHLDTPVGDLLKMVQKEDSERIQEGTVNRKVKLYKKNTTAERLYNSNPNIPGVKLVGNEVLLDNNYFERVQAKLKSLYDPLFLPRQLGIRNPDLSKVSGLS